MEALAPAVTPHRPLHPADRYAEEGRNHAGSVDDSPVDAVAKKNLQDGGQQEKAEQGTWPTKTPLGYLNVTGPDGRKVIAVDPEALAQQAIVTGFFVAVVVGTGVTGLTWLLADHLSSTTVAVSASNLAVLGFDAVGGGPANLAVTQPMRQAKEWFGLITDAEITRWKRAGPPTMFAARASTS